jgi:hypothetical protein
VDDEDEQKGEDVKTIMAELVDGDRITSPAVSTLTTPLVSQAQQISLQEYDQRMTIINRLSRNEVIPRDIHLEVLPEPNLGYVGIFFGASDSAGVSLNDAPDEDGNK